MSMCSPHRRAYRSVLVPAGAKLTIYAPRAELRILGGHAVQGPMRMSATASCFPKADRLLSAPHPQVNFFLRNT